MSEILQRLDEAGIQPTERLGQHFLIDEGALDFIANQVIPSGNVLEIGSGIGNLTERLATRARRVIGIEIDTRFRGLLDETCLQHPNVEIAYQDALQFDYRGLLVPIRKGRKDRDKDIADWQVVANLPYHITEPFLLLMAGLPVESIVMTLGDSAAKSLATSSPHSVNFSKMSLVSLAYFHMETIGQLPRDLFYPVPRTDSSVVKLFPIGKAKDEVSPARRMFRHLLETEKKMTVEQAVKQAMQSEGAHAAKQLGKQDAHRYERRTTRMLLAAEIDGRSGVRQERRQRSIQIPEEVGKLQFGSLDNSQIRTLAALLFEQLGTV